MTAVVYVAMASREVAKQIRTYLTDVTARIEMGGVEDTARSASTRGAQIVITDSMEGAWEVQSQLAGCRTILLATDPEPTHVRAALYAGVDEVLILPDELPHLRERVQALLSQHGTADTSDSLVVAVYSGSGGMGRTTTATALARAYARHGLQTLLIDASLALGGVDHLLGLTPPTTLANLLPVMAELDAEQLSTATVHIESNLDVLCSPGDSLITTKLGPEHLEHLVNVARQSHQAVVLDMPSELGPLEMALLRQADLIAYLMTSSPAAIRVLSHVLTTFDMDGVARNNIGLVHRLRLPAALELVGSELAHQVGLQYAGTLPYDWARAFPAEASVSKRKGAMTRLDQAAHRLALRLAALSGRSLTVRPTEPSGNSQRPQSLA